MMVTSWRSVLIALMGFLASIMLAGRGVGADASYEASNDLVYKG
jgi:hypothetical protein